MEAKDLPEVELGDPRQQSREKQPETQQESTSDPIQSNLDAVSRLVHQEEDKVSTIQRVIEQICQFFGTPRFFIIFLVRVRNLDSGRFHFSAIDGFVFRRAALLPATGRDHVNGRPDHDSRFDQTEPARPGRGPAGPP